MTGGHDARPTTASPGADPDSGSSLPALAVGDRRHERQVAALGVAAEQVADDLAIVIAFQEVMWRRGFTDSYATRHHLEELLRVLTGQGARST